MIPKFRAWSTDKKIMAEVRTLRFTDELVETDKFVERSIEGVKLMQSTGLLDKNGKEIFEGDILGTNDGLLDGVVKYRTDLGMWTNDLLRYNNFERLCSIANSREIIGNVYENPELLEVEI